ncbi:outer membrane beta-barrel protein [Chitinophaga sp. SYP-B3965]|uniref:porin family protein n=1 Tax=Chitinophaga sp. SYP-B3965 TaxID=2663120 RepID=UPI001299E096|nr:porin family protein [Chitinophaga sp. SYP-B3965]MRG46491.1 outer membrane beta-barrel protein [Chitinophaga sp. SYP-B3965]
MSEQFENSIRKKLEEADVPFDPAAWDDMKKRLDDSDRRRPVFWWWTSGFLLLLLLGGGGWWWYAQSDKTTALQNVPVEKTVAENINTPNTNPGNVISAPEEKVSTPGNTGVDNSITPKNSARQNSTVQNQVTKSSARQNATVQNQATKNSATPNSTTQNHTIQNHTTQNHITQQTTTQQQTIITETPISNNEPSKATTSIPFNQLQKTTEPVNVNNSPVIEKTDKPAQQIPDTTANTYTNVDKPKDSTVPKKKKRGFEGGITLGPDYNIASSFERGKIGYGAGLLLRYHVNNRLNISVGAIYTKKVYGAAAKDYTFPYPTNYVKIDANCDVLDVPLNVHYTFLDQPKGSWSAMAGASTYLMLKEKYDYYWANNNKRTREFSNQNQHYFSVLNLGVTYERKTAGRLKWALQPYVKVPLNGVGEGKVKLNSAGVSLQLILGKKD